MPHPSREPTWAQLSKSPLSSAAAHPAHRLDILPFPAYALHPESALPLEVCVVTLLVEIEEIADLNAAEARAFLTSLCLFRLLPKSVLAVKDMGLVHDMARYLLDVVSLERATYLTANPATAVLTLNMHFSAVEGCLEQLVHPVGFHPRPEVFDTLCRVVLEDILRKHSLGTRTSQGLIAHHKQVLVDILSPEKDVPEQTYVPGQAAVPALTVEEVGKQLTILSEKDVSFSPMVCCSPDEEAGLVHLLTQLPPRRTPRNALNRLEDVVSAPVTVGRSALCKPTGSRQKLSSVSITFPVESRRRDFVFLRVLDHLVRWGHRVTLVAVARKRINSRWRLRSSDDAIRDYINNAFELRCESAASLGFVQFTIARASYLVSPEYAIQCFLRFLSKLTHLHPRDYQLTCRIVSQLAPSMTEVLDGSLLLQGLTGLDPFRVIPPPQKDFEDWLRKMIRGPSLILMCLSDKDQKEKDRLSSVLLSEDEESKVQ
ncbi:MAG: hypothetical protein KVP17_003538 [Porospora cf. gigantea B]|uniref:uncharacterized protein n=1 Tax=Porospora cf. gigantea B TaxID=2853592 RepID=UPI00357190A0|nr:MAG: hypothetical protein KVP17_003538 [Porospora cf. gigantea B]